MDKALKDQWVAALRSGNYRQCKGHFVSRDSKGKLYCAFGVLFTIAPDMAERYVGTLATVPGRYERRIMKMNDEEGRTFAEIADYIEANL